MAKVEKRFEKYKPLQKKNLRFFKLVVHVKNKGTFEDFIPMFSRYERSLPLQPVESRFSLPLPRGRVKIGRVKERSRARTRITRTQQVFVFQVHPSPGGGIG